jgi:outer membrane receptor protein involved in Fe transport
MSAFYTRRLADEVVLFPGQPALDLVSSAPLGGGLGGGPARLDFNSNVAWRGAGLALNGGWVSGYEVPGAVAAQDLSYSGAFTLNLRAFVGFDQRKELLRRHPFLKGLRVTLRADNLLDAAPEVRDAAGITPYTYQKGFLAPAGRTVEIALRKQF